MKHIKSKLIIRMIEILSQKWDSVLVTLNSNDYFKAKEMLVNAGIKHKSKVESLNPSPNSIDSLRTYEIKVKMEDSGKAYELLRDAEK